VANKLTTTYRYWEVRIMAETRGQEDFDDWNDDIIEDTIQEKEPVDYSSLVVYSRDWTIETIYNQIEKGNIDLNPKFQRRNAWKDEKRSRLIESLITGIPVPEIVLAEHPKKKKSFIVIDGKQRLLTIAGFMNPEIQYWEKPKLSKLIVRRELNGLTFEQITNDSSYENEYREFLNADVRCTIISNYESPDILYDIFYRLNTGSVPLSSQELRQVLNKGPFAEYLMRITNETQPIHKVLKLDEPDPRLRDVEMILRFMSFTFFSEDYKGNLRKFLDDKMGYITENWAQCRDSVEKTYEGFNRGIINLRKLFDAERIGRKFTTGKWESRLNKVLFEVEVYYFMHLEDDTIENKKNGFVGQFKEFCSEDTNFRDSIEISTADLGRYAIRHKLFCEFINGVFDTDIPVLQFNYNYRTNE